MLREITEKVHQRHFIPSFTMLMEIIDRCPADLWGARGERKHPLWQYIYHALAGAWVWFSPPGIPFEGPPGGKELAELEVVPANDMTKVEVKEFAEKVKERADSFFDLVARDDNLMATCYLYKKITNLDIIMMQVRHIQHHVGFCNMWLSEKGVPAAWQ